MQSLNELQAALLTPHAPTEKWPQQTCSSGDIRIDKDGRWYYQDSEIKRQALCRLFASVLQCQDSVYTVTTPAEQCEVGVKDVPFIIVGWRVMNSEQGNVIVCQDNLEREWPILGEFEIEIRIYQEQKVPYLKLNYGLSARVNRLVYYQWAEIAEQDERGLYLSSAGLAYYLT
jgi:hypothetical protein